MRTVAELFESTVARSGAAPAVVFEDSTLGYAELNARANRMARRLIAAGVEPDSLVAIAVPRSIDLVVVVLAVLKAGGAYLPLDPDYPAERLVHMTSDARPVLLLRSRDVTVPHGDVPEVVVDDPAFRRLCAQERGEDVTQGERRAPLLPEHLMYVIYTSGSTGTPKGVAVPHEGVADLVATQARDIGAGPGDRILQWASISFDAAFWDLTLALLSGATLVLAHVDDVLPGQPLRDTLLRHDITHAVLPPVALSATDSDGVLVGGVVMSTGDTCSVALARKWSRGRRMFNGYGPTEVTVGATIAGPLAADADEVGIGRPWVGQAVYVLDEQLREVPADVEGELFVAGSGLARCYLNRPEATAARFLPDPFGAPDSRMYRTGDRGRRRADGELFFAGRADDQVKVRGFRVELGEVEASLAGHPDVAVAAAAVEGELADARIIGYVTTAAGSTVSAADLRRHVGRSLPLHMVPSDVVLLDRLPTTVTGKIDRDALRRPPRTSPPPIAAWTDGGSYEDFLCALVVEVLGVSDVRPEDNFFDLGGHSVLATRLAGRIRKDLRVSLPMRAVFEAGTLADLAAAVRGAEKS